MGNGPYNVAGANHKEEWRHAHVCFGGGDGFIKGSSTVYVHHCASTQVLLRKRRHSFTLIVSYFFLKPFQARVSK